MAEYIEREAAINEIEKWYDMYPESDVAREALSMAKQAILKIPAADVRPVRKGKWIDEPIKGIRYHCSGCQGRFDYTWRFCPNCGADMREES